MFVSQLMRIRKKSAMLRCEHWGQPGSRPLQYKCSAAGGEFTKYLFSSTIGPSKVCVLCVCTHCLLPHCGDFYVCCMYFARCKLEIANVLSICWFSVFSIYLGANIQRKYENLSIMKQPPYHQTTKLISLCSLLLSKKVNIISGWYVFLFCKVYSSILSPSFFKGSLQQIFLIYIFKLKVKGPLDLID